VRHRTALAAEIAEKPDEYQTYVRKWHAMLAWLDAELANTVKE